MKMDVKFDYRELVKSMREVEKETGKEWPFILNKSAVEIAKKAMSLTPKAVWAKMQKWATSPLAERLVLSRIRKGQDTKYAAGAKLTKEQLRQHVRYRIGRMKASIGYIRIGFANAIRDLGGAVKGNRKASKAGYARYGKGIKANTGKLIAEFTNTSTGSDIVAVKALQQAVDWQASTNWPKYLQNRLSKILKKHSAK